MRRLLVLAVAGSVLLGACGGSSSSSDSRDTASTTTRPPGTAAERRIAHAGLLADGDLPGSQKVQPSSSEASDLVVLGQDVPECKTFFDGNRHEDVNGRSNGYQRGAAVVNSSVAVYANAEDAAAQLELYRDPSIIGCLEQVYRRAITSGAPGTTLESLSVSPVAVEDVGDGQFGFRVTAQVNAGTGTPKPVLTGIAGIKVGRAISSINVTGSEAELAEVQSTVISKLATRLKQAGA